MLIKKKRERVFGFYYEGLNGGIDVYYFFRCVFLSRLVSEEWFGKVSFDKMFKSIIWGCCVGCLRGLEGECWVSSVGGLEEVERS